MRFSALPDLPMMRREFDAWHAISRKHGAPEDRECRWVPQPDGRVKVCGRFMGRVASRDQAEAIRRECERHLWWLTGWHIEETED